MNKDEITKLIAKAEEISNSVPNTIILLTAEKPLTIFTDEEADNDQDSIYDMPIGYYVDKHENYIQGAIQKVIGDDVTLFLTGESWGETLDVSVHDLPFDSQIELLRLIIEYS